MLGDSGVLGSFEMRYGSLAPEGPDDVTVQPFVFTDVAWVWNEDPSRRPGNPDRPVVGGRRRADGLGPRPARAMCLLAVPLEPARYPCAPGGAMCA